MPGFHGPQPQTSGGIGNLQVVKSGHFIDLTGTVQAQFAPLGSWELVWRKDSPAGSLVCGLDLQQDAVRNHAVLPQGRVYLTFPVWNARSLREYQERKAYVSVTAAQHLQDRDDELQKMQATHNLFAKALHYRNAAAAVEKYSLQPVRSMALVPSDEEVIRLTAATAGSTTEDEDNDLFLTRMGTVWTKNNGKSGLQVFGQQTFLGAAVISQPEPTDDDDAPKASWSADSLAP